MLERKRQARRNSNVKNRTLEMHKGAAPSLTFALRFSAMRNSSKLFATRLSWMSICSVLFSIAEAIPDQHVLICTSLLVVRFFGDTLLWRFCAHGAAFFQQL